MQTATIKPTRAKAIRIHKEDAFKFKAHIFAGRLHVTFDADLIALAIVGLVISAICMLEWLL
jgi:hypothetical protein